AWEKIPIPSQPAIEAVLAASENPKAKGAKWDQFVDDRFVKELVASGVLKYFAYLFQIVGKAQLLAHRPQAVKHGAVQRNSSRGSFLRRLKLDFSRHEDPFLSFHRRRGLQLADKSVHICLEIRHRPKRIDPNRSEEMAARLLVG